LTKLNDIHILRIMNNKKRSIYLCYSMNFISAISFTVISPSLPRLGADFNLNHSEMGLLFTFQFIGFTAFTIIAGIIADHIGKRMTTALFTTVLIVCVFLFAVSPNYLFLCVVLLFLGGGLGVFESMSNALLSDICEDESERTYQINYMQCFFGIGAVVGPILVSLAYSNGISWRSIYQMLGALLIALIIWFVFNRFPALPPADKIRLRDIKELVTDKKFLLICLCIFFYTGSEVGSWGWMAEFTESVLDFTVMESGVAVAVFWSAMTVSRFIAAKLLLKADLRKFIMWLSLFAGVISAVMGFSESKAFAWVVIILLGFACSGIWGMILSYGAKIYTRNSGTVFSTLIASGGIGISVVPGLMGITAEHIGLRWSLGFPAAFFAIITILFVIIPRLNKTISE